MSRRIRTLVPQYFHRQCNQDEENDRTTDGHSDCRRPEPNLRIGVQELLLISAGAVRPVVGRVEQVAQNCVIDQILRLGTVQVIAHVRMAAEEQRFWVLVARFRVVAPFLLLSAINRRLWYS